MPTVFSLNAYSSGGSFGSVRASGSTVARSHAA